jgi:mannose-6-phosphate isomerase-like protein (cupin superfamily)
MPNHDTVIVRKPWGYEYLAYKNKDVALWLLHINPGERTSMHCHPNKSTGLVVLDGSAEINFIADSKQLHAPAKQMIRRGLFHQTHAVGDTPVLMFEIETPVDKDDLVRLHDNYGRKDSGYEDSKFELPKTTDCLWIDEVDRTYIFGDRLITVELVTDNNILDCKDPTDIIMFLQGGLIKTVNGRQHEVVRPGDVGTVQVVQQVAKEMDGFATDSIIMTIK